MGAPSLAIVIAYAGESQFLEETLGSIFENHGIAEIVVGVDLTRTTKLDSETAWTPWIKRATQLGIDMTFVYSEKAGPSAVRNLAIAKTNAAIILPVDSDDRIHRCYVEKILESYSQGKKSIGIVYGKAELFGESSGEWQLPKYSLEKIVLENCIYATSAFLKADWVLVGGYDEDLIYGQEDWDFWLKLLGLGRSVYFIDEVVFYYRIRSDSRSAAFRGMWEQVIWTYDRVCANNERLMASQVKSIYHRRVTLELENSTLTRASKSFVVALVRKYPKLKNLLNTKLVRLIAKKLEQ